MIGQYREYLQGKRRSAKTLAKYEYAFGLFTTLAKSRRVKTIQDMDLTFVDAFRAERMRNNTEKQASAKTVHNDLVLLRQVINLALRRKLI